MTKEKVDFLVSEEEMQNLESASAQSVLEWALKKYGDKIALASSFGAEDVVLIDMIAKIDPKGRIFTLDTGRLPQETYEVIGKAIDKYGVRIEIYYPQTKAVEEMVTSHGPNLFYESIELRKLCCGIRKVEPLNRALAGLSAWISGLRREQSVTRAEVKKIEFDKARNSIAKVNPLADWTETQVWNYIRENDVPYNKLHDQNYPSIGCAPCTRAIEEGEDLRAGRWWWEAPAHKECGLHVEEKAGGK